MWLSISIRRNAKPLVTNMAAKGVIICLLIVLLPMVIYILYKLCQGTPVPQPDGDIVIKLNKVTDSRTNICSSLEEPYNRDLYIGNNIDRLKLNQDSCDVHLVHPKWSVHAHKIILAAHSETFEKLLESATEYTIPDRDYESFPALLEFIYDRKIPDANFVTLKDLLIVAERYQVLALKCLLEQRLQSNLNISNVGNALAASIVANATYLKIASSIFLMDNLQPVSKTDTWKKVSRDIPSIYSIAVETAAEHSSNSTKCHIECASGGFDSANIINRLKRFFITEKFTTDNLVLLPDRRWRVNRAILVEQSDVWMGEFRKIGQAEFVTLPPYTDAYTMKEFLIYMYSGWVAQLHVITNNLLLIANEYQMEALKNATETILLSRLNVTNVAEYLMIAQQAQSLRMMKDLAEYFFEHRKEIQKTDSWIKLKAAHPEVLSKILL